MTQYSCFSNSADNNIAYESDSLGHRGWEEFMNLIASAIAAGMMPAPSRPSMLQSYFVHCYFSQPQMKELHRDCVRNCI